MQMVMHFRQKPVYLQHKYLVNEEDQNQILGSPCFQLLHQLFISCYFIVSKLIGSPSTTFQLLISIAVSHAVFFSLLK